MQEDKQISVLQYAMHYGMLLGLFWAFKYMFSVIGETIHVFKYFFFLLNAATFLLIYNFYIIFRDADPKKQQDASNCLLFVIAMCFFASFFESMAVFLHIQIIDPSFYLTKIEPILQAFFDTLKIPSESRVSPSVGKVIYTIIYTVVRNVPLGLILGGILSLIVGKQKK